MNNDELESAFNSMSLYGQAFLIYSLTASLGVLMMAILKRLEDENGQSDN